MQAVQQEHCSPGAPAVVCAASADMLPSVSFGPHSFNSAMLLYFLEVLHHHDMLDMLGLSQLGPTAHSLVLLAEQGVHMQVNGMLLAGQKVYVGPFLKKSDRPVDRESHFTNVYVKNLPDSVNDEKLNEMFSEHGSVTSAVVMKVRATLAPSLD